MDAQNIVKLMETEKITNIKIIIKFKFIFQRIVIISKIEIAKGDLHFSTDYLDCRYNY